MTLFSKHVGSACLVFPESSREVHVCSYSQTIRLKTVMIMLRSFLSVRMRLLFRLVSPFTLLLFPVMAISAPPLPGGTWGLGVSARDSGIPYKTDKADDVGNMVPYLLYEGEYIFLRQGEFGFRAYQNDSQSLNVLGKRRYVNLPKNIQNEYQEDSLDWGVQWLSEINTTSQWRAELLTAGEGRHLVYGGWDWYDSFQKLDVSFNAGLRYKNAKFNSYYYGLSGYNGDNINPGVEAELGLDVRYPLIGPLYLTGGLEWVQLDKNARHSAAVDKSGFGTASIGIAIIDQTTIPAGLTVKEGSYMRVAHGWATPSNMNAIFKGNAEKDKYNNQLSSVFYGYPLKEDWLDLPIDVFLASGLVYHHNSRVQGVSWEGVAAIKAYLNFNWPVRWRFGLAEGLSYISDPTYIEKTEMKEKGNENSKLMNYLDVSLDINLGDITRQKALSDAWVGWSMHHRSSMFKKASQFGRIKGGSNYNTVYIQWGL